MTGKVDAAAQGMAGMAATNDRLISSEHAAVDQVSTAATAASRKPPFRASAVVSTTSRSLVTSLMPTV